MSIDCSPWFDAWRPEWLVVTNPVGPRVRFGAAWACAASRPGGGSPGSVWLQLHGDRLVWALHPNQVDASSLFEGLLDQARLVRRIHAHCYDHAVLHQSLRVLLGLILRDPDACERADEPAAHAADQHSL